MFDKRLLILGSGEDFVELTKLAVKKGIYTVVADGLFGPAKQYASKAYTVDLNDAVAIDQICRLEKIDHVLSSFSDYLFEMMVNISARNNLPCFCSADKVRYLRDKMLMKDMLSSLNIESAQGHLLNAETLVDINEKLSYPCVIKPLDGWGSKGMKIVYDSSELLKHVSQSSKFSTSGSLAMVESINPGHEYNVMSWIKNGKAHLLEFADRETSGGTRQSLPYLTREAAPSYHYAELKDTVLDYLEKIAEFIGIKEGPLSMQFFYHNKKITIGEVAGRFFGLGQGIVPVINGINLNELLINMLYFESDNQEILKKTNNNLNHCSVALYLKAKKGVVRDVGNAENFITDNVDGFTLYATPGQSTSFIPWIVRIYAHFETREAADQYCQNIYENLFVPGLEGENLVAENELTIYEE